MCARWIVSRATPSYARLFRPEIPTEIVYRSAAIAAQSALAASTALTDVRAVLISATGALVATTDAGGGNRSVIVAGAGTLAALANLTDTRAATISGLGALAAAYSYSTGAAPTIVSRIGTNGPNSSSPAVVNLPASIVAGNKLVIIFGHNPTATVTTPSGWSLLDTVQSTIGTNDRKIYIFQKTSDGTEGSTVNITISGQTWSAVAYQISGSASSTLVAKVGASVASTDPDPPNNNPGSSALTLWIAAACKRQTTTLSAAPSGYANLVTGLSSGSNVSTAAADKTSTASSEDPGTFTGSGSDNWAAITLGFRA